MSQQALDLEQFFDPPTLEAWRDAVAQTLKGKTADKLKRKRVEDITVEPIYSAAGETQSAGLPDVAPFTRGVRVLDRRQAGWDIRQCYDAGTVSQVSAAIADDQQRGVRSLWLVLEDSGIAAHSPHGGVGLAVEDLATLGAVLESVDLGQTPVALETGAHGTAALTLLLEVAQRKGVLWKTLTGSLHTDPVGHFARTGSLPHGWDAAWDELAALLRWGRQHTPWFHLHACSGLPYHDAGASAVQELAYILASTMEFLRAMAARGLAPQQVAGQGLVQIGVGRDMFMELAKPRALRQLWSKLWGSCGVAEDGQKAFIHAVTGRTTLSRRDPWVNLLRGTAECFSAAVGGVDAITLTAFDRMLGVPETQAMRLTATTQRVLEQESHLSRVADPAGGSWYIETLTDQLARKAWALFQDIEARGGLRQLLDTGEIATQIQAVVARRQRDIAKRKAPVLGVSEYANPQEELPIRSTLREAPNAVGGAACPLTTSEEVRDLLTHLKAGHCGTATMEGLLRAARAGAKIREMRHALHPETKPAQGQGLASFRWAEAWEVLRDRSDAYEATHGHRPAVFLANLGPIPSHKARAAFAQRLFEAGGFAIWGNDGFESIEALVDAYQEARAASPAQVVGVVLCGSDADYPAWTPALAKSLKAQTQAPAFLALAGRPGEHESTWRHAGIEDFLYMGCDALGLLTNLQQRLGLGGEA